MFSQEWSELRDQRYLAAKSLVETMIRGMLEERYLTHGGRWENQKFVMELATHDGKLSATVEADMNI